MDPRFRRDDIGGFSNSASIVYLCISSFFLLLEIGVIGDEFELDPTILILLFKFETIFCASFNTEGGTLSSNSDVLSDFRLK